MVKNDKTPIDEILEEIESLKKSLKMFNEDYKKIRRGEMEYHDLNYSEEDFKKLIYDVTNDNYKKFFEFNFEVKFIHVYHTKFYNSSKSAQVAVYNLITNRRIVNSRINNFEDETLNIYMQQTNTHLCFRIDKDKTIKNKYNIYIMNKKDAGVSKHTIRIPDYLKGDAFNEYLKRIIEDKIDTEIKMLKLRYDDMKNLNRENVKFFIFSMDKNIDKAINYFIVKEGLQVDNE